MNRWETWRPGIPYLMPAAILMLAAATYRNGMVLDDSHTIQYNPALRSLASAPQWVTSPYAVSGSRDFPNYRPMLVASYALDQAVWGPGARGYHATNLGIHLGVVTLGFVLARRLWGTLSPTTNPRVSPRDDDRGEHHRPACRDQSHSFSNPDEIGPCVVDGETVGRCGGEISTERVGLQCQRIGRDARRGPGGGEGVVRAGIAIVPGVFRSP